MENPRDNRSKRSKQFSGYARYSGVAVQMLVVILLGVWGGLKLDEKLNSDPVFTIILSLFSVFASLYISLKDFIKGSDDDK